MALRARSPGVIRSQIREFVHEHRDGVFPAYGGERLISVAAHAVLVRDTGVVEHPTDSVRLVTLDAGRDLVRLLGPQPAFDQLDVDLLDA